MDGHFGTPLPPNNPHSNFAVPNITIGPPVVTSLRKAVPRERSFFDCHMMVSNPDQWVDVFAEAGAGIPPFPHITNWLVDLYCFHIEALHSDEEIEKLIEHIKANGMKVGIAIKPKTPSTVLYPFIQKIDMALVMVPPEQQLSFGSVGNDVRRLLSLGSADRNASHHVSPKSSISAKSIPTWTLKSTVESDRVQFRVLPTREVMSLLRGVQRLRPRTRKV